MNKLMVVGCAALAALCGFADEQTNVPAPAEIAKQEAVQESLLGDDGVSIVTAQGGSFTIFSRGTGTYDFSHPKAELNARKVARLNAEKHYAKFINTTVVASDTLEDMAKDSLTLDGDGKVQNQHASMEDLQAVKTTITANTKAVLSGLVVLESKKIATPGTTGGTIQLTMVYSSKTAKAALATGKAFQNHQAELKINEAKNEGRVNATRAAAQSVVQGTCQTAAGGTDSANASGTTHGGCQAPAVAPVNKSEIRVNKTEY